MTEPHSAASLPESGKSRKLDAALCPFPGYARYADDFVVCCSTLEEAESAKAIARATFESLQLQLHPEKSFITDDISAKPVKFLGFSICPAAIRVRSKNIDKFKASICEVVDGQIAGGGSEINIRRLLRRLRYKVCGPEREELCTVQAGSIPPMLYRRCWIGYFRCVTDIHQIKMLDNFILGRISHYAYSKSGIRLKRKQIRAWGLPSLVSTYYKGFVT